jgi:hypothetical protein
MIMILVTCLQQMQGSALLAQAAASIILQPKQQLVAHQSRPQQQLRSNPAAAEVVVLPLVCALHGPLLCWLVAVTHHPAVDYPAAAGSAKGLAVAPLSSSQAVQAMQQQTGHHLAFRTGLLHCRSINHRALSAVAA